jgi:hypothetical protein
MQKRLIVGLLIPLLLLFQVAFGASRETQYAEALTEQSYTGDTNYHDHVDVTATLSANKSYAVMYSANRNFSNTSTSVGHCRLYNSTDAVTLAEDIEQTTSTNEYPICFGLEKYDEGASPASHSFVLQAKTAATGSTIKLKNAVVLLMEIGADDEWAESEAESTTTSTSYQTKTTLTFTPATGGDYQIIAYGEVANSNSSIATTVKLSDGTTAYGESDIYPKSTNDYRNWITSVKLTLPASSQTFTIQYKSPSSTTAKIQRARIWAIRLDSLDNAYYAESRASSTTTSTTYQDKVTLTQTPEAVEHVGMGFGLTTMNNPGFQGKGQTIEGSTTSLQEHIIRPISASEERPWMTLYRKTMAAASTTWKTQYATSNGAATAGILESAIAILQTAATPVGGIPTLHLLPLLGVGK